MKLSMLYIAVVLLSLSLIFGCTSQKPAVAANNTVPVSKNVSAPVTQPPNIPSPTGEPVVVNPSITTPVVPNPTVTPPLVIPPPMQPAIVQKSASNCDDSDEGINIYKNGTVTYKGTTYEDACISPTNVKEYLCQNDKLGDPQVIQCPVGYICKTGACVQKEQTCKDTHLSDADVKNGGYVTLENGTGYLTTIKDICFNITHVKRSYCDGNQVAYKVLACPSDVTCETSRATCTFPR